MNGSRKGIVASLDAVFAILLAIGFSFLILAAVSEEISSFPIQLQRQGADVLTVLEDLESFTSPEATFNKTSDSICMRLEVFNGTSNTIDSEFVKLGCPSSSLNEKIIWRTSTYQGVLRTAKLAVWLKGQ